MIAPLLNSRRRSSFPASTDLERTEALLERVPTAEAQGHIVPQAELDRAEVREPTEIPPDVVTMNSQVTAGDETTGERLAPTLVYPAGAGEAGRVSILVPVGSALLGLAKEQHLGWPMPDGRERLLRGDIGYQPEAAGDFHR